MILAFDPDTKTTGMALIKEGRPVHARLIAVANRKAPIAKRKLAMLAEIGEAIQAFRIHNPDAPGVQLIVVEGQRIYPRLKQQPNDILVLGQVAGGIVAHCQAVWPGVEIVMPEPREWKGSVPKAVFTRRILRNAGLAYDERGGLRYLKSELNARVPGTPGLGKTDASHVIDAIGLGLWARS